MTQFSPSPANPYVPGATRTRLRWDNLAVLCAALAVVGGVTTTVMSQMSPKPKAEAAAAAPAAVAPAVTPDAADGATAINAATLEDANMLVSEARDFISQGRWEEAADRLASVDASMRPATEADIAQRELEAAQGSWTRLDAQLRTQVEAQEWTDARATLEALVDVAPLGEEQLDLQEAVEAALAPATAATTTKPAATTTPTTKPAAAAATTTTPKPTASTGGGAAATTTKPAATTPKPKPAAATTPKPATTTPKPAADGSSSTTIGGITITMPAGGTGGAQDIDAAQLEQLLGAVAG